MVTGNWYYPEQHVEPDFGKLIIRSPDGEQVVTLRQPQYTIGRNPARDLHLDSPVVSNMHGRIDAGPQGAQLVDLGSTNGTFIGERRLPPNQPYPLVPGEEVRIGPFILIYIPPGVVYPPEEVALPVAEMPEPPSVIEEEPLTAAISGETTEGAVGESAAMATPEAPSAPPSPPPPEEPVVVAQEFPERLPVRYAASSDGLDSRYLRYLPAIFQENEFLGRYLRIFETIWEPLEWRQNHINLYFDPRTCPLSFLPWLAGWLDMEVNPYWPESRIRRLIAEAADLYRWRGTAYGLKRLIEVVTGLTPTITEEPSQPFVFRISLALPPGSDVDARLIDNLVRAHKPAHAGYILDIRQ
ncbi:phage tail protein I [Roseiflexus castenholzii]|jgi:phage tail-like protein|uniref:FHA domain containing protein n=1 Tax=Roseiflexus castenholzii (strain DSM 13941 / HLO8) TaxID=383372 RepID=A7NMW0_ROSCS|nr:phage tail protein I [Roseiflexus castenholzii]ABU58884.1 FHA domain containing protein [Roseiflexus castenholzii DSM 13941]